MVHRAFVGRNMGMEHSGKMVFHMLIRRMGIWKQGPVIDLWDKQDMEIMGLEIYIMQNETGPDTENELLIWDNALCSRLHNYRHRFRGVSFHCSLPLHLVR